MSMAGNPNHFPIGLDTPSEAGPICSPSALPRAPSLTHTENAAEDERRSPLSGGAAPGSPSAAFCQGGFKGRFVSSAALSRTTLRPGPLRVAAYIRVSTDSSDQENSYEAQERYFSSLLLHHPGWIGAGIYADYGLSGTSGERRTGYNRLLRHCREEKLDRIVCKSISRFARNTSDFMTALALLHDHHVAILFEKESLDTADPTSAFILTTLAAIAQEESRSISANVLWSLRRRYPQGLAPNFAIYGYRFAQGAGTAEVPDGACRLRRVEIVPEEAEVVRRIFSAVCGGMSFADIARMLNAERIPAPCRRKPPAKIHGRSRVRDGIEVGWTGPMIARMIRLERYCGDVLLQKTYTPDFLSHRPRRNTGEVAQYWVRGHHPAIVSWEVFERAQAVRQAASERYARCGGRRIRHALSGLLVCGECGRCYTIRAGVHSTLWYCPTSALNNGSGACHAERLTQEQARALLCRALAARFGTDGDELPAKMMRRLEAVHRGDCMERSRSRLRQTLDTLAADGAPPDELEQLRHRLSGLQAYGEKLEDSHEAREQALAWMNSLPRGPAGAEAFLRGFSLEHARAFALSITVYSPASACVFWFDGTRTRVLPDGCTATPAAPQHG